MWQRVLERRLEASASCGLKLFKRPCARGVRLGPQLWIRPDRPSAVGDEQRGAVGTRVLDCGFGGGSGRNRGCDVVIAATPIERDRPTSSDQHAALPDRPYPRTSRHAPDHRVGERASNASANAGSQALPNVAGRCSVRRRASTPRAAPCRSWRDSPFGQGPNRTSGGRRCPARGGARRSVDPARCSDDIAIRIPTSEKRELPHAS